jgi:hypothetical protein
MVYDNDGDSRKIEKSKGIMYPGRKKVKFSGRLGGVQKLKGSHV